MALHNLHLYCNPHIDKDKVVEVGLRFNPRFPTKWLPTQLRVLDNVLCNLVKYQNENKILFYKRNTGNIDQRYNPHLLGHKVLVGDEGVLAKLKKAQLIKVKTGDNKTKVPREKIAKGYQIKMSEFSAVGQGTLEFAKLLGITKSKIKTAKGTQHILLSPDDKSKKLLPYKDSKLTIRMEELMKEYCKFLNTFSISCDGEKFEDIMLTRRFRDCDGNGSILYGGRSGRYWHELKKTQRPRIKINRSKTVQLDYVCSAMNVLYAWKNKTNISKDEQYNIEGFEGKANRQFVKQMTNIMLNANNSRQSSLAFEWWLARRDNAYLKRKYDANPFNLAKLQRLIKLRHKSIATMFYQPKIGMNLQFLESSLVFEVAVQLCRRGIPTLTCHDEFIVPQADKGEAEEVMYSTYIDKRLYRSVF